jgi:hypothetical protein
LNDPPGSIGCGWILPWSHNSTNRSNFASIDVDIKLPEFETGCGTGVFYLLFVADGAFDAPSIVTGKQRPHQIWILSRHSRWPDISHPAEIPALGIPATQAASTRC